MERWKLYIHKNIKNANHSKTLYLFQLFVSLQDQVNDVTDDRDFPLRETPLEKLLLVQYGLIVEDIPQYLHMQNTHIRNLMVHYRPAD